MRAARDTVLTQPQYTPSRTGRRRRRARPQGAPGLGRAGNTSGQPDAGGHAAGAAQRNLVVSVASLAKAEIGAEARVGDNDLIQATEDQLRDFPATRVILVTGPPEEDQAGEHAAKELNRRLAVPLIRVISGTAS